MDLLLTILFVATDVNRKCWYVTTKGMHAVGQAEVVILLQCLPDEKTVPKDVFTHFVQLYQEALSGENTPVESTSPPGCPLRGNQFTVHPCLQHQRCVVQSPPSRRDTSPPHAFINCVCCRAKKGKYLVPVTARSPQGVSFFFIFTREQFQAGGKEPSCVRRS